MFSGDLILQCYEYHKWPWDKRNKKIRYLPSRLLLSNEEKERQIHHWLNGVLSQEEREQRVDCSSLAERARGSFKEKKASEMDLTGREALYRKMCMIWQCNSDLSILSLKYYEWFPMYLEYKPNPFVGLPGHYDVLPDFLRLCSWSPPGSSSSHLHSSTLHAHSHQWLSPLLFPLAEMLFPQSLQ